MSTQYLFKRFVYLLILFAVFFLFVARSEYFLNFKSAVVRSLSGPIQFFSFPGQEAKKIFFYHRTFEECKRLGKEAATFKKRLGEFEEVQKENIRLEQLLGLRRRLVFSSVTARVIGRDPSNWNATMIIDKGRRDRVAIGMPVVDVAGVVGKIIEVSGETSKVILLTDPQFSVAAIVKSSRESGVVSGSLQGICRMRYINPDARIKVGDVVMTSKLSTSFPENLNIGEVVGINVNSDGVMTDCTVRPAVLFSQLEEVLVLIN